METMKRKSGTKVPGTQGHRGETARAPEKVEGVLLAGFTESKRGEAHSIESQEKSFRRKEKGQHDKIKAIMITGTKKKREKL